jgi:hypothetical protein
VWLKALYHFSSARMQSGQGINAIARMDGVHQNKTGDFRLPSRFRDIAQPVPPAKAAVLDCFLLLGREISFSLE